MEVGKKFHLTYCTNIHPGENWPDVKESLNRHLLEIKTRLSPDHPFGVGLRLSNQAAVELLQKDELAQFRDWLDHNNLYVFTLNGFPYGNFHGSKVKDTVHKPDWTTNERVVYTKRLFQILSGLVPDNIDGGISTSPLSYKHWTQNEAQKRSVFERSTLNLLEVVDYLQKIHQEQGRMLHLDIEPEPDGLIENTQETIDYFEEWLIPEGKKFFALKLQEAEVERVLKNHIRICYDVCHFAVEYEDPAKALDRFDQEGILIGKIQISAALRAVLPNDIKERSIISSELQPFNESTYLHQVIEKDKNGQLTNYPDLPQALDQIHKPDAREWRSHFHVPIFVERYQNLLSTRDEIEKVLNIIQRRPVTDQLEVETYTWEVLPLPLREDLNRSIERELNWVLDHMGVD